MSKKVFFIILCFTFPLLAGCDLQQPMSTSGGTLANQMSSDGMTTSMQGWVNQLLTYQRQIDEVKKEIESVEDLSRLFGRGEGSIQGDGTFIGEGNGTADLSGIGIVTGELTGTVMIQGTDDINITGLEYVGNNEGYETYSGTGFFTATSDAGQKIQVIFEGEGWVIGAGTGIVFWSGHGWVFWYH